MRRSLALVTSLALIVVAAAAVALAFASTGSSEPSRERASGTEAVHAGERAHRFGRHGFGPLRALLDGLAERLDVTPERLREAIHGVKRRGLDRAVAEGVITSAERDALLACMSHDRGGCDRAAARGAARKLHQAHRRRGARGLIRLKALVLGGLAAELGKPVGEVRAAARAELAEALDRAVAMGILSGRGRGLALACFDRPRACDLRALRAEAFRGFRRRRGP